MKNLYFDTETTDLNPGQIGQLAYILEEDGKVLKAKNFYFKVTDEIAEGAYKAHGMSKEFFDQASKGRGFKEQYREFYDDFVDARLVAHNEQFDEKFISMELWRQGISFCPKERQCTMEAFKEVLKIPAPPRSRKYGPYKSPKLSEVLEYFKISEAQVDKYSSKLFEYDTSIKSFHDARFDTTGMYVAVNVYREIIHGVKGDWQAKFCI